MPGKLSQEMKVALDLDCRINTGAKCPENYPKG